MYFSLLRILRTEGTDHPRTRQGVAFAAVILIFVFVPATSTWLPNLIYG